MRRVAGVVSDANRLRVQAMNLLIDTLGKGTTLGAVAIGAASKSVQITLTWTSPLDKFKLSGLRLANKGHLLAVASRPGKKPGKLKVSRTLSSTFAVINVSHLHKGQLSFAVKAATAGSGEPKVSLTTRVGQSSHK